MESVPHPWYTHLLIAICIKKRLINFKMINSGRQSVPTWPRWAIAMRLSLAILPLRPASQSSLASSSCSSKRVKFGATWSAFSVWGQFRYWNCLFWFFLQAQCCQSTIAPAPPLSRQTLPQSRHFPPWCPPQHLKSGAVRIFVRRRPLIRAVEWNKLTTESTCSPESYWVSLLLHHSSSSFWWILYPTLARVNDKAAVRGSQGGDSLLPPLSTWSILTK